MQKASIASYCLRRQPILRQPHDIIQFLRGTSEKFQWVREARDDHFDWPSSTFLWLPCNVSLPLERLFQTWYWKILVSQKDPPNTWAEEATTCNACQSRSLIRCHSQNSDVSCRPPRRRWWHVDLFLHRDCAWKASATLSLQGSKHQNVDLVVRLSATQEPCRQTFRPTDWFGVFPWGRKNHCHSEEKDWPCRR